MVRFVARFSLFLFMVVALTASTAVQVRAFEPPPALVPEGDQARTKFKSLMFAAKPSAPGGCEQDSVEVDSRIVKVKLNETYADSTIFNPATDDPWPNHRDPLHLRSYGGCKPGPLIALSPDDTLRLDLKNDLPSDDPSCWQTRPWV